MAIGRTFRESFAKAMRSRELDSAAEPPGGRRRAARRVSRRPSLGPLRPGRSRRFRRGRLGRARSTSGPRSTRGSCASCEALATEGDGTDGLARTFKSVDTCAAEFEARTPYYYSAHERSARRREVRRGERDSVVILGSGPNRIGQGIEFDYCCVHAAMTVRESGRDAVMINCNPETVSTDYDTSDRLYFEPLTAEDVLAVVEVEQPEGVIVQFGGQTPLRLAAALQEAGVPLLGTPVDAIDLAEDRGRFGALLRRLEIAHPPYGTALSADEAVVDRRGRRLPAPRAPLLRARRPGDGDLLLARGPRRLPRGATSRPTRSTRCSSTASSRTRSRSTSTRSPTARTSRRRDHAARRGGRRPLGRLGLRAAADEPRRGDARRDPRDDAADRARARRRRAASTSSTRSPAASLYVIEANPRASRTVPFVSKAIGAPLAKIACRLMLGERARRPAAPRRRPTGHVSVKEAVLPFARFAGADSVLGPEMKSTGEVMGIARRLPDRVRQGAGGRRRLAARATGTVFITVTDTDKPAATQLAARFHDLGFRDHRHPGHRAGDLAHGRAGEGDQQDRARARPTSSTTSATARSTW